MTWVVRARRDDGYDSPAQYHMSNQGKEDALGNWGDSRQGQ